MSIDDFMLDRGHPYMTIAERDAAIAEWNTSGQACKRCHGDGFAECRCVTVGAVVPDTAPRVEIGGPGWRIAEPARLHPDDIEAIARRVAELLRTP